MAKKAWKESKKMAHIISYEIIMYVFASGFLIFFLEFETASTKASCQISFEVHCAGIELADQLTNVCES